MKWTTLVLICLGLQVSLAASGQNVKLLATNASLESIFSMLREQSGYNFIFESKVLRNAKPVSVDIKKASLEEALNRCFENQPLTYSIVGETVIIKEKPVALTVGGVTMQQQKTTEGRVLDEQGNPLNKATVTVSSSGKTYLTDDKGNFSIQGLTAVDVLKVSFMGYHSKEVVVGAGNPTIRLKLAMSQLEEVVMNTGYQTIAKERSAGSFAKADMDVVANRSGSMNILQRLDGLIPGLVVNNAPGADQNPLLVRGLTTIGVPGMSNTYSGTSRNPLFVVDGIPMDNVSSINPQDVEDVTVLKDATAASIWGARASNGVIVITTKKAKSDERLSIQYDGFINFMGKPDLDYLPRLNSAQFIQAARDVFDPVASPWNTVSAYSNNSSAGIAPHERILYDAHRGLITQDRANSMLDSLAGINNRSQIEDLWYRNASLMNHTLSMTAGGKVYGFYGSGAFTENTSNRPGEKNQTYKLNVRQDFNIGKRLKLNLITDLTNGINEGKRNISIGSSFYPYQLFRDGQGNNLSMPYMQHTTEETRKAFEDRSKISLDYNPLDERDYGYTKNGNFLSRNIFGARLKLIEGLNFEGTYGFVKGNNNTEWFDSEKSYAVRSEVVQFTVAPNAQSVPVYYLPKEGGRYRVENVNQQNWTVRNQLSFDRSFADGLHQVQALVGHEAQEQLTIANSSVVRGYDETLQTSALIDYNVLRLGLSSPVMPTTSGKSTFFEQPFEKKELRTRFTSYYANAGYTYDNKYTLNASFRSDESNLFGLDKSAQNRPIWSVGGKWNVGREDFVQEWTWLDNLALRATYGMTGNSPAPGTAASYDILGASTGTYYPGSVGLILETPSNAKLTWERTETINLGVDFSVLSNRLNASIDLYQKKTSDLIGDLETNSFTGYNSIIGNMGDLENKGIELNLRSLNWQTKDFTWSSSFNIAYNKNTITNLLTRVPIATGADLVNKQYVEGYTAFTVFAYPFIGLDNMGDPQIRLSDGSVAKDPRISKPEDIIYKGTYQPVWTGGFSNALRYKNFDFMVNAVLNLGHVMRTDVNSFYSGRINHNNVGNGGFGGGNLHADFDKRWRKEGDEATTDIPSYVSVSSTSSTRRNISYYTLAEQHVVSASYIKIRDISLAYSLPVAIANRIKASRVALRAQVSNLMLWKANDAGIDPEFHNGWSGSRVQTANQGTFTLGLNVKF